MFNKPGCAAVLLAALSFFSVASADQGAGPAVALPLFAVEIRVGPGWDTSKPPGEQPYFKEHSTHLKQLRDAGHIVMGARYSDLGLLVFAAESADSVREMMRGDPSMQAGTFRFDVHPMNAFYPWRAPARNVAVEGSG